MFAPSPRDIETRILNLGRYSPELLPSCIVSVQFRCEGCSFGDKDLCILLQDTDFLRLLRWKILNLSKLTDNDISDDLVISLIEVIESQGSALHVDKILGLLLHQKPQLRINLAQIKSALTSNPELFQETDANVFFLNSVGEESRSMNVEED